MKINKVKLYNFSSYEGNNEFDFEITDAEKNIVLIGGKNGAGKTSLFTAIKVALYGPLAYGYVGVNSHYISKIKDLINSKAFQQEIVESEVQITLQLKIERDIRNYVITRKWDYTNQRLTEEYTVERDIKSLDDMLIAGISTIDGIHATVDISKRLPGIVSLVVDKKNFHNERFIKKISEEVALSTGSACSAGEPSYVIQALGLANEVTKVLRVSINKYTTEDDINSFLSLLKTI